VKKTAIEMTDIATIDTETTGAETVTETTGETTVVAPTHQTAKTVTDVRLPLLKNLKQPQVSHKLLHQRMRNSRRREQSLRLGRRTAKLRRLSMKLKSKQWLLQANPHQVSTFLSSSVLHDFTPLDPCLTSFCPDCNTR
jgi:hypothetical protein